MIQSHFCIRFLPRPNASTRKTQLPQTTSKVQSRVLSLTAVRLSCSTTSTITLTCTPQRHYHSTKPLESITLIIHPAICASQPLRITYIGAHRELLPPITVMK